MKKWIVCGLGLGLVLGCRAEIKVSDVEAHGLAAWKIETSAATYIFQKPAGGFSSIIDRDGNDWLSYKPGGGPAGEYRGIPNAVHPEGYFHPGSTNCVSELKMDEAGQVVINARSDNDQWASSWTITDTAAHFTMLKAAKNYWFLYEGTPGGKIDVDTDWVVRWDGARLAASEIWKMPASGTRWYLFGDGATGRALLVVCYDAEEVIDSYWPMQKEMTVFGFGRGNGKKYLTNTPCRFTIAMIEPEAAAKERLSETVNAIVNAE